MKSAKKDDSLEQTDTHTDHSVFVQPAYLRYTIYG